GDEGSHAAVEGRIYPPELVLARRPITEHRMNVRVDQPRRDHGAATINHDLRASHIAILELAYGTDNTALDNDGIGVKNGPRDIAGQQQPHIVDDDLSRSLCRCFDCHIRLLES